jgi:hypothetical protein
MQPLAGIYHAFDASFAEKLITKGWIEKWVIESRLCYPITDQGLAAKKVPA